MMVGDVLSDVGEGGDKEYVIADNKGILNSVNLKMDVQATITPLVGALA